MWDLVPWPGIEPSPLHWEYEVPLPGKSPDWWWDAQRWSDVTFMIRLLTTLGLSSHYHFPFLALSLPDSAFSPRWSKLPPEKTQIVQSWGWPLSSSHQGTKAPCPTTSEEVNLAKIMWCSFEAAPSPVQASDKTAALAETLVQPFEKL